MEVFKCGESLSIGEAHKEDGQRHGEMRDVNKDSSGDTEAASALRALRLPPPHTFLTSKLVEFLLLAVTTKILMISLIQLKPSLCSL